MQIWPGKPYPLGATFDGSGTNFSLFSGIGDARRTVPVRRPGTRNADRPAGEHRALLARLPAAHQARPALWIQGARPVGSGARTVVQPLEGAARSLRQGDRRALGLERGDLPVSLQRAGELEERTRQRALRREERRHQPVLRLGQRSAPEHALAPHGRLRNARQGLQPHAPGHSGRPARDVRRARASPLDRVPEEPRHHRGGVAARSPVRPGLDACRAGPAELLGLQLHRLPRAAQRVFGCRTVRRAGPGIQEPRADAARRRHRSHPRRGLQPHGRGQPPGPDAVVQGHRQPGVLPADA